MSRAEYLATVRGAVAVALQGRREVSIADVASVLQPSFGEATPSAVVISRTIAGLGWRRGRSRRQATFYAPKPKPGFHKSIAKGVTREVRLGSIQREKLEACAKAPQRCGPANPSFRRLLEERFVTSEQHFSARSGRPTLDRLYTITALGRVYLKIGRDR